MGFSPWTKWFVDRSESKGRYTRVWEDSLESRRRREKSSVAEQGARGDGPMTGSTDRRTNGWAVRLRECRAFLLVLALATGLTVCLLSSFHQIFLLPCNFSYSPLPRHIPPVFTLSTFFKGIRSTERKHRDKDGRIRSRMYFYSLWSLNRYRERERYKIRALFAPHQRLPECRKGHRIKTRRNEGLSLFTPRLV